ncbi:MAG: hypothetical protein GWO20_12075 [Candidatus Korarchaeota archaeon]|nr:hypothetical protein [Candidatus Korarchaeota archaeon]NIU84168.1 hypothetical protein [Candidatus Thorarchaeota archaeon]NIW14313.1 hypothetical protein [Candidatus Thorarchaeota archaeon]NIW52410.1 hypothetical protein [Candidatus Korarchaeota archaeon]
MTEIRKEVLAISLFIIGVVAFSLITNFDVVTVRHAKASEMLPVIKYTRYSTRETTLFYLILGLAVLPSVSSYLKTSSFVTRILLILTILLSGICIFLTLFNPHLILLSPTGLPPTKLDELHLGGVVAILLAGLLGLFSAGLLFFQLKTPKMNKKHKRPKRKKSKLET